MTTNHKFYLNLAFEIAARNLGKTKHNPSVGALVVKNNSVISSGVTSSNGRPHAEYNALKNNKNLKGADLYTTLEPCTHYGVTPPCVNIIKKKKIKNIY
jgi:diaminohydroxyphosphoribosylaminopyrimidine deaminase / 5-amino-6-(5-phosphoribosylamino)uracil reductase